MTGIHTGTSHILAFDVGGSHISAAVCQQDHFQLGPVVRAPYAGVHTSDGFADLVYQLGCAAQNGSSPAAGAMLAVPGPFDLEAGISQMRHKLPYLYGVDLRRALATRFGWQAEQICFLNDANAFLLGEAGAGAARGFDRAVGLTLGTGIGSAFAIAGRVVTEGAGVPPDGEIWNLPYANGIVEDYISTRAIVASYESRTGKKREVAELAAVAASDPAAQESFAEFGQHLGQVIQACLSAFAPQVIVLGGGIARSAQLFLPAVHGQWTQPPCVLRVSELGDSAPLAGCGVAWFDAVEPRQSASPKFL